MCVKFFYCTSCSGSIDYCTSCGGSIDYCSSCGGSIDYCTSCGSIDYCTSCGSIDSDLSILSNHTSLFLFPVSTEVMEDLQKLLPGFPGVNPQGPFLQVAPNMNFTHNLLPMQSLQPTGQLEYKVGGHGKDLPTRNKLDLPLVGSDSSVPVLESFLREGSSLL